MRLLLALVSVLAGLLPTLAAPSAHAGTLAGRDAAFKHRDMGKHGGHRRKVLKRACKAKTSGMTSVTSASAVVASYTAIGENAQASVVAKILLLRLMN
jgi:hypothetical protein